MTSANSNSGKGRPTPARKQQEAARKKPLLAPKTKESRKAAAEARRKQNTTIREGYAAGDDKYLPKRDAGPVRRLIRDYVDSQLFTAGDLLVPAMIANFLIWDQKIANIYSYVLLGLLFFYGINVVVLVIGVRKLIAQKFANKQDKGVAVYVAFRTLYPRYLRLPRPQVRRGEKIS